MESNLLMSGVRVLDFSRMVAGPVCTALLADIGAEVLKVEPPQGDDARQVYPFSNGESALFLMLNRNKKGTVLDLKSEKDRQFVYAIASNIDVIVENYRPGVAKRLGIDYETLRALNPKLVYVSISGFGQAGPMAQLPSYDLVAQAMTGLMSVTGSPDGPPTQLSESFADMSAGIYAAWAVCAAIYGRERSGVGCHVDVALFDSLFSMMTTSLSQVLYLNKCPMRVGNRHPVSTPFGSFLARDGSVVVAVANNQLFERLVRTMEQPDLALDARFASDHKRTEHEQVLRAIIESWTSTLSVTEVVDRLERNGVPCCPIQTVQQAAASEHVRFRQLLRAVQHPRAGTITVPVQPVKFSCWPDSDPTPAPLLGEHADSCNSFTATGPQGPAPRSE